MKIPASATGPENGSPAPSIFAGNFNKCKHSEGKNCIPARADGPEKPGHPVLQPDREGAHPPFTRRRIWYYPVTTACKTA